MCVHARSSLFVSLKFSLVLSIRVSLCLSLSLLHTHTCTHGHLLSLIHSLTHAHTHRIFNPIFSHTHTHFSLSFFLFLSTNTHTHTQIREHTFFHFFTRPPPHSWLSRVSAALSSANVRACSLLSLFLSPFLPFVFFSLRLYFLVSLLQSSLAYLLAVGVASATNGLLNT